ncbi:amidohydrolase [Pseudoxanthomonas kalamensis DSM 18571]|nr:amidohydrolase [Pseudoxanthomonas kalamensis DSM 18571]
MTKTLSLALCAALLGGCAHTGDTKRSATTATTPKPDTSPAFPSTYQPIASPPVLISGATVLVGDGRRLENADVLLQDGKIAAIGTGLSAPADAIRVDGQGKWVTPGLIDIHSHLGVYASPGVRASSDGNEAVSPNTAQVWAEHSVWPQDPGLITALAGGITTLQILPGSANLFGGRGVTLKNVPSTTMQGMKFPGAPYGLKMACGENPKRVYGQKGGPSTRMGSMAGYRAAFIDAAEYARKRKSGSPGKRDLKLETLAGVLDGSVLPQIHCYRADEMANMIDLSKEFGFKIAAFHHGVEAYKLADTLAAEGICGALWADWWGFKMEAFDGIQENVAIVDRDGKGCAIVHSDSDEGIQRLNQESAKVIANAERAGMNAITPEHAIRWLTANPAKAMGILDQTGTLEEGKMADVVLWNRNPFSSYALAEQVYIDGARLYDRNDPAHRPVSDFMLGQEATP